MVASEVAQCGELVQTYELCKFIVSLAAKGADSSCSDSQLLCCTLVAAGF